MSGYNFHNILYFLSDDFFNITSSVDADEMPPYSSGSSQFAKGPVSGFPENQREHSAILLTCIKVDNLS